MKFSPDADAEHNTINARWSFTSLKMIGATKIKGTLTRIGSYLIFYLAGIPFRDCTNAFKMFSVKLKNKIQFESTIGFTFALELVSKSFFLRSKIVEIPSTWVEIENRKSNFKMLKWIPFYIYWLLFAMIKNFVFKIKNIF